MTIQELRDQRKQLVIDEYNTYSPEHFPGSKRWNKNMSANDILAAFDVAHPEILAEIREACLLAIAGRHRKDVEHIILTIVDLVTGSMEQKGTR